MDTIDKLPRRELLKRSLLLGATAVAAPSLLAACGGEKTGQVAAALTCTDVSGLSEADKMTRTSLQYVDKSTQAGKVCSGCQLYQAGAPNACGTCTVVKGPIHPDGYCASWVAKPA